MKKLLAILGSATLAISTGATVVACGQSPTGAVDFSKFNNSLANMQGSVASITKQLILSDQFNLSTKALEHNLGGLSAKDVVQSTTGLEFDSNDFNLKEDSELTDLNEQYFDNRKLDEIKIEGDINLKGTIGLENGQLWRFLKDSLGVNLGETQNILETIFGVLSNLNSWWLQDTLSNLLPGLDLKDLLDKLGLGINGTLLELISTVCKAMFENEKFVKEIKEKISSFDIGATYSEMKVGDITSAAMISLSNTIGLFVQPEYQVIELTATDAENSEIIAKQLITSSTNLGTMLGKKLFPSTQNSTFVKNTFDLDLFKNDFEANVARYVTAIANLFHFLELIQFHFSLFDSTKNYQPIDSDHLFVENKTNKEYIKETLESNKTLREVAGLKKGEKIEGSLNLKYLLSIFRSAFKSLDDSDDQNGYSFQKFLTILLISPLDVDINNFKDSMVSPVSQFLGEILSGILIEFLRSVAGDIIDWVAGTIKDGIKFFLTASFEVLLINPGETLTEVLIIFLDKINFLLGIAGGSIEDPILQNGLKAFSFYWNKGVKEILPKILDKIPLLSSNHPFQELYSGNPLKLEDLIVYLKNEELLAEIQELYTKDEDKENDPLGKLLNFLAKTLSGFAPTLNNLLPGELNLKNLFTTPLNQISNQSSLPPAFGDHYLSKSIKEIIQDLCSPGILNVTGNETLNDIPDNFNFKLSYLSKILEMIISYQYEGLPDGYQGMNLISIILENPDQLAQILGLKEDKTFGEGSLLDLIFNKILNVEKIGEDGTVNEDPFKFFAILLSSIFNNLNHPNLDKYEEAYKKLFSGETKTEKENAFEFSFQSPVEDDGALLGQIVVVKYHNPQNNTNWTYTLNYSREKVSERFQVRLFKKVAI